MKKQTKIILGVTAIAGAAAAITACAVTAIDMLSDMAVAKKVPRVMSRSHDRLHGAIMTPDSYTAGVELAKKLESREHECVSIVNRDGLRLVGHYFKCDNAKRVVICMHGWRSGWSFDFGGSVDFWLGEGCSLLLVEQRSHGKSEGDYIGFGVYERYDCLDWIEYVKERERDLPIYLCGISMGATSVLMAAGLGLDERVHGIIADCGFTSPRAIWSHVMKKDYKLSDKLAYPIANFFISKKAGYDGEEASTVEAMRHCSVPVLFIHGDADEFVPHSMTLEAHDACTADKSLLIVKGASHGMSYFVDTEGYQKNVRDFFGKND